MNILVTGATGATGKLLVNQLLKKGHRVKAIVRSPEKLIALTGEVENLIIIQGSLLNFSDQELINYVAGCNAVISCLGHNLTFKGIYGKPRRLVADATKRLCLAVIANKEKEATKFILMNTAGNQNRDLDEPITFAQRCIVGLVRILLPPHADNELAANYLRTRIGQNHASIEWAAVRPDGLVNLDQVTPYTTHPSPTRSAIFNTGKTSRINVAHFMSELITNNQIWQKWKGQMPVIYNTE